MTEIARYASRVAKLPLVDADGATLGKVDDLVFAPIGVGAPRLLGFVTSIQRRHIFVNANRVGSLESDGVRMRSGSIDVRPFRKREGELLAIADLVGTRIGEEMVLDVSIVPTGDSWLGWEVESVALAGRGPLARRRSPRVVPWTQTRELFKVDADAAEVARLRDMRPADVANRIRSLPHEKRQRLAEIMDDDRLADLLEEMPEDDQIRLIEQLDIERAADILEEMDPDDAADLLAEMDPSDAADLLDAMEADEAGPVRRLLSYGSETAGGLMTPEPVIMDKTATVAEALAVLRTHTLPQAVASQVFVVQQPLTTPTGLFLGTVGFQRLLREPPSRPLGDCLPDRLEFLGPETSQIDVAARLAAYDIVAVAVCDSSRRLIGAVTIDDVVDHMLPDGWRRQMRRSPAEPLSREHP